MRRGYVAAVVREFGGLGWEVILSRKACLIYFVFQSNRPRAGNLVCLPIYGLNRSPIPISSYRVVFISTVANPVWVCLFDFGNLEKPSIWNSIFATRDCEANSLRPPHETIVGLCVSASAKSVEQAFPPNQLKRW